MSLLVNRQWIESQLAKLKVADSEFIANWIQRKLSVNSRKKVNSKWIRETDSEFEMNSQRRLWIRENENELEVNSWIEGEFAKQMMDS